MDNPKISVLIPMYNRKHYIQDCINSALNQTFKDYEIIIRDDGSTDGSAEFVEKIYAKEISAGKIKLSRNEKNLGEWATDNRLILEATGKYIAILHSDDMYLPHALQHLYEVAEKFSADVVHESYYLAAAHDLSKMTPTCSESHPVEKITVISDEPAARFSEWTDYGTFVDFPYSMFKRKFILENEIFFKFGNRFLALWWIMLAKVFVKTPTICYVWRASKDSKTRSSELYLSYQNFVKNISDFIEMSRRMDEFFPKVEFFKDSEENRYMAKAYLFQALDAYDISRWHIYKDGITPEIQRAVAEALKKYFGDDYFYPAFLFHLAHILPYNKRVDKIYTPAAPPLQPTVDF